MFLLFLVSSFSFELSAEGLKRVDIRLQLPYWSPTDDPCWARLLDPINFHHIVFIITIGLESVSTGGLAVLGIVAITVYKMCRKMPEEEVGFSLFYPTQSL